MKILRLEEIHRIFLMLGIYITAVNGLLLLLCHEDMPYCGKTNTPGILNACICLAYGMYFTIMGIILILRENNKQISNIKHEV